MAGRVGNLILILIAWCAALSGCGGGSGGGGGVPFDSNPPPPPPIILHSVTPDVAQEGSAPFTITVMGADFTKSSKVIWNGTALPTTFVKSYELQALVSTPDTAPQSGVLVTVSTPGYVCNNCGLSFELTNPPNPNILSLSPSGVTDGTPSFTLKVMGTGFIPASYVQWNGSSLPTTYVSGQELDVTVPAASVAAVGTATVTVQDAVKGYYLPNTAYFPIGYTVTVLDLLANDLVWDPVHALIYISLQSSGPPADTASIATYDPATGTVGTLAVTTPYEADRLAVSDDSSFLYAGYDLNSQVVRFTLPSGTLDETINLPPSTTGSAYPLDIEVQPGAPHSFATVITATGASVTIPSGGIQIYDDTTPRPNALPYYTVHQIYDSTSIQWSADGTKLYGADGVDTDATFFVMNVDATGVTSVSVTNNVFGMFYPQLKLDPASGDLFSSDSSVIDPTVPDYVYFSQCIGYYALPDDVTGRAYYLTSSNIATAATDGYTLLSCDKATGKLISAINLPVGQLFPSSFIRFGTDGLAFTTSDGKVILVQGHFVAP